LVGWLAVFCFDWQLKEAAELASRCFEAPLVSMKTPVPSITRSTFIAAQGSVVGSREETTLIGLPLTVKVSSEMTCCERWAGGGAWW
jgi:hypothetical protein